MPVERLQGGLQAVIVWKITQFRRFRAESETFMRRVGGAETTDDAFHAVKMMDASPFTRLFQRGLGFFREMRPGAARAPHTPVRVWVCWRR